MNGNGEISRRREVLAEVLARDIMEWRKVIYQGRLWWANSEGVTIAPVAHWDVDYPMWDPCEYIIHAKMVQLAMVKKGYEAGIRHFRDGFTAKFWKAPDLDPGARGETEAEAICKAAYSAAEAHGLLT